MRKNSTALLVMGTGVLIFIIVAGIMLYFVKYADDSVINMQSSTDEKIQDARDKLEKDGVNTTTKTVQPPDWYERLDIGSPKGQVEELSGQELDDCYTELESQDYRIVQCEVSGTGYVILLTFENDRLNSKQLLPE